MRAQCFKVEGDCLVSGVDFFACLIVFTALETLLLVVGRWSSHFFDKKNVKMWLCREGGWGTQSGVKRNWCGMGGRGLSLCQTWSRTCSGLQLTVVCWLQGFLFVGGKRHSKLKTSCGLSFSVCHKVGLVTTETFANPIGKFYTQGTQPFEQLTFFICLSGIDFVLSASKQFALRTKIGFVATCTFVHLDYSQYK